VVNSRIFVSFFRITSGLAGHRTDGVYYIIVQPHEFGIQAALREKNKIKRKMEAESLSEFSLL